MDTSSKNKNKWRWFIGIIVGIAVVLGACIAMQYILAAKEAVGESAWTGEYSYYGKKVFVKFINGMKIHYTTSSNQPEAFGIVLGAETAQVLAKYGEKLLFAGMILCMFLLVWFLRSQRIWKQTENPHRLLAKICFRQCSFKFSPSVQADSYNKAEYTVFFQIFLYPQLKQRTQKP